jgi:anti-sigma B factor antagonist
LQHISARSSDIEITESRQGAVTVIKPVGPLCRADAQRFSARLDEALAKSLGRLVVDASGIAFVDSAGLEALAAAGDKLSEVGMVLKLCGTNETVREVLELTELSPSMEYFDDVQNAVRSFL